MATPAMQSLPVGIPKVMVSTVASGNVRQYVGPSDICMMYSVTDVAGISATVWVAKGDKDKIDIENLLTLKIAKAVFLGIDLGTSAVKAVLVDEQQRVGGQASRSLRVDRPMPLWAEQDPALWWTASQASIREVLETVGVELTSRSR